MKVTKTQKQFLIVWFCIHTFALIVNLARIKGDISHNNERVHIYVWTTGSSSDFWPFVTYLEKWTRPKGNDYSLYHSAGSEAYIKYSDLETARRFNGIFEGYDFSEFAVYAILGLAIVFLPQLWKETNK